MVWFISGWLRDQSECIGLETFRKPFWQEQQPQIFSSTKFGKLWFYHIQHPLGFPVHCAKSYLTQRDSSWFTSQCNMTRRYFLESAQTGFYQRLLLGKMNFSWQRNWKLRQTVHLVWCSYINKSSGFELTLVLAPGTKANGNLAIGSKCETLLVW